MRRTFATLALVLALGYLVPLFPLPWGTSSTETEAAFLRESWYLSLLLLIFNVVGAGLLFRPSKAWSIYALAFSSLQVAIWWSLSGLLVSNGALVQFLGQKLDATWLLVHHTDPRVAFVALHQEILVGAFYHLALLWLLLKILVDRKHVARPTPI